MNILVFSPYYPPHIGGLESHSDEFNRYLSQRGIKIFVFTPRLPQDAPETEIRHNGVTILRFPACELIPNYPLPKFWRRAFWTQWNVLLTNSPDLIISRTRFFFTSLMAWRYAKKCSIPWLHIEHGSDFAKFNGSLKTSLGKLYDQTVGRFVLCHADHIIGNSQASADFVKKLSGRVDSQVIYRGANIEEIEKIVPNKDLQEKYHDKTIIAFIGRLIDGKGTADLITAFSQLKRDDTVLFIIGGGPEEVRLKNMTQRHHLEHQIVFFGNLPFNQAISILKVATIVVNPSYTEGLPTSVTEAALCQKAIIATSVGGTPEVISGKNDGWLIAPNDIQQLKDALSDLINHPEKCLLFGQNAKQTVREKFSWERATMQYLSLFDTVSQKKQSRTKTDTI